MKKVGAILLAAGQSRRMGAFKPLLSFGKRTVVESCVEYLFQGGVDSIVIVVGHRSEDIRQRIHQDRVSFAINPDASSEMGASIAVGVSHLPKHVEAAVISLVDYPAVPPSVVATLISEWDSGFLLVKPTWKGRGGHPVLVDLSLRMELQSLNPEGGLKELFHRHQENVRRVEVASPYIARDIDTWDDYRALYVEVFGEPAPEPNQRNTNE